MNEETKGFKYRLSNILAWLGFSILLIITFEFWVDDESIKGILNGLAYGLPCYIFFGILNYLLAGRMRLIPWIK